MLLFLVDAETAGGEEPAVVGDVAFQGKHYDGFDRKAFSALSFLVKMHFSFCVKILNT